MLSSWPRRSSEARRYCHAPAGGSAYALVRADPGLDVIVDDEVELLPTKPVVLGQDSVDLVEERL